VQLVGAEVPNGVAMCPLINVKRNHKMETEYKVWLCGRVLSRSETWWQVSCE